MSVRPLHPSELDYITPIGNAFTAEADYPGGFNIDAFKSMFVPAIQAGVATIWVSEIENELAGALGACFVNDPFSGQKTAMEQFWYVLDVFRSSRAGSELYSAFESEALIRGCKKMVMVHLTGINSAIMARLYRRKGYKMVEQSFWKVL